MKLRYRILGVASIVVTLGLLSLALVVSYDSPCGAPVSPPGDTVLMKAAVSHCYGSPDVVKVENLAKPSAADNEILVKVHAAALNALDWRFMRGQPYLARLSIGVGRPANARMGVDFAGTVEAVGKNVTRFKPGDEVFGGRGGALAEYVTVREDRAVVLKPANLTFEQAAAVPVAAVTALQGLRDKGHIQPGQKVLINGASGGVGTFAVQIAKSFGADVTGICSTRNLDLVRSLGADQVVDYTREDFTQSGQLYDLILDNVGNRSPSEFRRVLKPTGTLVIIGAGSVDDPWVGPFIQPIKAKMLSPFVSQELGLYISTLTKRDLEFLSGLMQAGKVTPVIDRHYPLSEVSAALRYLEEGRARGKVIVTMR